LSMRLDLLWSMPVRFFDPLRGCLHGAQIVPPAPIASLCAHVLSSSSYGCRVIGVYEIL
jgi:hypothetical protein